MKNIIILFLLFSNVLIAQENIFLDPDKEPNCEELKNGKFASISYSPKEYYMIVKDGIQTEYLENGQYVKSKMEFLNDCEYKTTILEVTIPNYYAKVGDFLTTKILQTQCEYIKVRSTMLGKDYEFVFVKMN
ncbi:hypothetical protein [Flavobacterium hydatis]|uniref:Uncharacterized protein n=1 Tax=Flavobacterium hydatis TaxID=991 RepID=A0A086AH92_FLAHY|nr:hypothetical protein [Flavobacterium hydatis]KFF16056.1 hypothetical protein IW20_11975 [Flavobacterium hydatis]OXA97594.1 hypothetical protein B0A62_01665 [Flavobacterium hydatis]